MFYLELAAKDVPEMAKNSGLHLHEQESDFLNSEMFFTIDPSGAERLRSQNSLSPKCTHTRRKTHVAGGTLFVSGVCVWRSQAGIIFPRES